MSASALVAHLSTAALGQRYRAARQPIERSHLQIVWLLSQGRSEREVAAVTGYGQRWITAIVRRYNVYGRSTPCKGVLPTWLASSVRAARVYPASHAA